MEIQKLPQPLCENPNIRLFYMDLTKCVRWFSLPGERTWFGFHTGILRTYGRPVLPCFRSWKFRWRWRAWVVSCSKYIQVDCSQFCCSKLNFLLPTDSGFTTETAGDCTNWTNGAQQSNFVNHPEWLRSVGAVISLLAQKHMPVAELSLKMKSNYPKNLDAYKLSREGCPNCFPPSSKFDGERMFTEELLQRVSCAYLFATALEDPLKNGHHLNCMIWKKQGFNLFMWG